MPFFILKQPYFSLAIFISTSYLSLGKGKKEKKVKAETYKVCLKNKCVCDLITYFNVIYVP